jgi:site-specific DNA-methyltransferase (adenine-specific)
MKGSRNLRVPRGATLDFHAVPAILKVHPTEKPTALLEVLVEESSVEGELVLDPFAGSASTLKAARNKGRRGLGFEVDFKFWSKGKEGL